MTLADFYGCYVCYLGFRLYNASIKLVVSRNADTIIPEISSNNIWLSYSQKYVKMYKYAKYDKIYHGVLEELWAFSLKEIPVAGRY